MTEPVSRHFLSHRLHLHYVDWGNPDAPPLILLHGGNDHARSWDDVAQRLREDFHVIAPDLRGHGDSDWSPDGNYSITAHVIDLAELIRHLGGGPIPIVAHSFGARVALRHAGIFPESVARLVTIEAAAERMRTVNSRLSEELALRLAQHRTRTRTVATAGNSIPWLAHARRSTFRPKRNETSFHGSPALHCSSKAATVGHGSTRSIPAAAPSRMRAL